MKYVRKHRTYFFLKANLANNIEIPSYLNRKEMKNKEDPSPNLLGRIDCWFQVTNLNFHDEK
jgi:hypothetical protein